MRIDNRMMEQLTRSAEMAKVIDEWRIFTHYDADGICAGGILARTALRAGKRFHMTILRDLYQSTIANLEGTSDLVILADMGSSYWDLIKKLDHAVVLDHHKNDFHREEHHINPNLYGMDGTSDLCGSTLAFLFSIAVDPANWDLFPYAMAGLVGDRQHVPEIRGANKAIFDMAVDKGLVTSVHGLNFQGDRILDAMVRSNDPFIVGISGDIDGARSFLDECGVDPDTPVNDIDNNDDLCRLIASRLVLKVIEQGGSFEGASEIMTQKYLLELDGGIGLSARSLSHMMNSSGRKDSPSTGLAAILGDMPSLERCREFREDYRDGVQVELLDLAGQVERMQNIQFFENRVPAMGGALAGLGLEYFLDRRAPVIALTKAGDKFKISSRGLWSLVHAGLDLSYVMRTAGERVGGVGGGHPIASGATIPVEKKQQFLDLVDEIVGEQLGAI